MTKEQEFGMVVGLVVSMGLWIWWSRIVLSIIQ
jgi:hypothetical protein